MPIPKSVNIISARQTKAARAVMGLSVSKLADQVGISESSIRRIEAADGDIKADMVLRLQSFFERRGFTFVWEGAEQGIRWPVKP